MLMEAKERNSCSRAVIIGEKKTESAVGITRDFALGYFCLLLTNVLIARESKLKSNVNTTHTWRNNEAIKTR